MDIPELKNKVMDPAVSVNKAGDDLSTVTLKALSQLRNEYHFPGSGIWKAVSVIAADINEATELWRAKRVPLNPAPEKKVEPDKQTNNQQ